MSKKTNLQPWLDYFEMLHSYEQQGFLQMEPEKHEAYVTQPALHAMSDGNDPQVQLTDGSIVKTVRRLCSYAGFLSQQGAGYLRQNFAVHVVAEQEPHDLLYTVLLGYVRSCLRPWMKHEKISVIDYRKKL